MTDIPEQDEIEIVQGGDGRALLVLTVPGTTGHVWMVETSDGLTIEPVASDPTIDPQDVDGPVGGPYDATFLVEGSGSATMVLKRPWEDRARRRVVVRTLPSGGGGPVRSDQVARG